MKQEARCRNGLAAISLMVFVVLLTACGASESRSLYREAAAWIEDYGLPSESVAVPGVAKRQFPGRDVAVLPEDGDAFSLLATLQDSRPDFIVAWQGIAWDDVVAQPWFQAHYQHLERINAVSQPQIVLDLFAYMSSPFDDGQIVLVEQPLGPDGPKLRAVRVSHPRLTPSEPLYVTLFWDKDFFALPDAQRLVLRLVSDEMDQPLIQVEGAMVDGFPANLVREGDALLSHYSLAMPDDLPVGDYRLTLDVYWRNLAPIVKGVLLTPLHRPPDVTQDVPTPDFATDWRVGDAIALVGYDVPARVAPGEPLRVALYWHAVDIAPGNYKVFVHLIDADGNLVAQNDAVPVNWTYPTSQWQPGDYIRDVHVLGLDESLPRGDYALFVGMYDAETGVRLAVQDSQGQFVPENHAELRVVKAR